MSQKPQRIITCTGTAQLLSALAALAHSAQNPSLDGLEGENTLVIYDLFAPPGQIETFRHAVSQIAGQLLPWKAQVYLPKQQIDSFYRRGRSLFAGNLFHDIRNAVGLDRADELYLSRNWQTGNLVVLNAFPEAERICYGDGLGLYYSEQYHEQAFAARAPAPAGGWQKWSAEFHKWRRVFKSRLTPNRWISRPCSRGCFLSATALGETPPLPFSEIPPRIFLGLLRKLTGLLSQGVRERVQRFASGAPLVILLSSNFSEAKKMSLESELAAYRELFGKLGFSKQSRLLIKPHPRDSSEKIALLRQAAEPFFSGTLALDDEPLFCLPFELFLLGALLDEKGVRLGPLEIIAGSTAAISIHRLFGLKPRLAFGADLARKYFYPHYAEQRLRHEKDLALALAHPNFASGAASRL